MFDLNGWGHLFGRGNGRILGLFWRTHWHVNARECQSEGWRRAGQVRFLARGNRLKIRILPRKHAGFLTNRGGSRQLRHIRREWLWAGRYGGKQQYQLGSRYSS